MARILPKSQLSRWWIATLLTTTALLNFQGPPATLFSQEDEPEPPQLMIMTVSSVNRLREDLVSLIETREPQQGEPLAAATVAGLRDLRGLDREKPIALVVTLEDFIFRAMLCVPVTDVDALQKTITTDTIEPRKLGENEYYLKGFQAPVFVRVRNGYAFVSNSPRLVDARWPGLLPRLKQLAGRYDLAISSQAAALPAEDRKSLIRVLRQSLAVELQRGDNESETSHLLRSLFGRENLRLLELLLEADDVTLGWTIDGTPVEANANLMIDAPAGSPLSADLQGFLGSKQPTWAKGFGQNQLLSGWANVNLGQREQTLLNGLIAAAGLNPQANRSPDGARPLGPVIAESVAAGRLEVAFQLRNTVENHIAGILGIQLSGIGKSKDDIKKRLENLKKHPAIQRIEFQIAEAQGTELHRITLAAPLESAIALAPDMMEDWFTTGATIFLGVGQNHLWLGIGFEDDVVPLRTTIETAEAAQEPSGNGAPLSVILDLSELIRLMQPSLAEVVVETASAATKAGKDAVRLEFRKTPRGATGALKIEPDSLNLVTDLIRLGLSMPRATKNSTSSNQPAPPR